jgi:hypothetical protein
MCSVPLAALLLSATANAEERPTWYAGSWNSAIYALSSHPKTVAVRVAVEDADTRLPLAGVEVRLEGKWDEPQQGGASRETEFKLVATTNQKGIAVFALSWHRLAKYGVDDIDKVQSINARRNGYGFQEQAFKLAQIQEDPDNTWKDLIIDTPGAKYFVLLPGEGFRQYDQDLCKGSVFFEKIRDEDYGKVFRAQEKTGADFPNGFFRSNPPAEAGPFMLLPVRFGMKRLFEERVVEVEGRRAPVADDGERQREDARRTERERTGTEGERTQREQTERERPASPPKRPEKSQEPSPDNNQDVRSSRSAVETVTSALIKEKGLYPGTTGVYLNEAVGSLPAGVVVESIMNGPVSSAEGFEKYREDHKKDREVTVGIWKRNGKGKWERATATLYLNK